MINILENYDFPQLSSSSLFIRTDIAKNYKYQSHIKYSEDNRFINEILLDEKMMMLLMYMIWFAIRQNLMKM